MDSKELYKMVLDSADAVSYSVETAEEFLKEEEIDIEKYITQGLNVIKKGKELNKSQSYFRRAVLAAKIAHEYHNELAFGVIKFQKLVYLSEQISEMKFTANYRKQAAGPMDHRFIHSIKKEFEKQGWFSVNQEGQYKKWVFTPNANISGYETYYSNYFGTVNDDIQFLIEAFRKWKTDKVELIATLYACWKEAKDEKVLINDNLLIQKVYNWHEAKKKFSEEEILNSLRWMEENEIYPV